jgi:hypothetical protein
MEFIHLNVWNQSPKSSKVQMEQFKDLIVDHNITQLFLK